MRCGEIGDVHLNAAQKDVNEGRGVVEAEEAGGVKDDHLFDTQEFTVSAAWYAVMWEVYSASRPRGTAARGRRQRTPHHQEAMSWG